MRWTAAMALGLSCVALLASPALAHGDQFRDPEPGDQGPPRFLETPPPSPPPPPPPGAKRRLPAADWFFWWQLNSPRFENLRWHTYNRLGGPCPLFRVGGKLGPHERRQRWTYERGMALALPALLEVLDRPGEDAHVVAAAHLALAKVAREEGHVRRLARALDAPGEARVQEAAALGLGLLRRQAREDRFAGELLDEVREVLLRTLEDPDFPRGTRSAAALAIGLLGDQPVGARDGEVARIGLCARLTSRLHGRELVRVPGISIATLVAIGRQPPEVFSKTQRSLLLGIALASEGAPPAPATVRGWALDALGRVGGADLVDPIAHVPFPRPPQVARSRVLALAHLGVRGTQADRDGLAAYLLHSARSGEDDTERHLALLGIGRVLVADLRAGVDPFARHWTLPALLAGLGRLAPASDRPFTALAAGMVLREVSDDTPDERVREWRRKVLTRLRETVGGKAAGTRLKAACCIALGMARDTQARAVLLETLKTVGDEDLAASAAWGLGLVGEGSTEVFKALDDAMRRGPAEVRRRAVRAFALLGFPWLPGRKQDAVAHLLERLATDSTPDERRDTLVELARFGDDRAIAPLAEVLRDPEASSLARALAAAALGAVGDLELLPAVDVLRADANHRDVPEVLRLAFRIL